MSLEGYDALRFKETESLEHYKRFKRLNDKQVLQKALGNCYKTRFKNYTNHEN